MKKREGVCTLISLCIPVSSRLNLGEIKHCALSKAFNNWYQLYMLHF